MPQPRYIFLSHHSVDKPVVELLADKLEQHPLAIQHNIKIWLDKNNLKHGEQYPHQFAESIGSADTCAFLVFMPNESVRAYVEYEIGVAFDRQMNDKNSGKRFPILPVYPSAAQERIPLPAIIKTYNYRENVATDESKLTDILNDVIEAITLNEGAKTSQVPSETNTSAIPAVVQTNKTLSLPISDQWLCFDLNREGETVTATSVDDSEKTIQLATSEILNSFPEGNLAQKLFPSVFPENGDSPKRLRIRTEDNDLAMLPWAQLHPETIVEVSSISTHYRPDFNKLNITNPLAVVPTAPKRINANTHYRLLHEYFNGYLNIRGPVPRVSSRKSFLRALKHHEPDLLYFFASVKGGKIVLDAPDSLRPNEALDLSMETLGECIQEAKLRPVVVISLLGEELTHYPKILAENCRVLWIQSTTSKLSSKSKHLEDILAGTLERLGQENDLVALINDTFAQDRTIQQNLWVSGQSPQLETQGLSLIHRLRAALLRVMLGREDLKDKLYSQILKPEHLNAGYCLAYIVTGDEASCPFDVPSQLQQRLDQDDTAKSLPIINFPLSLTVDPESDPEDVIAELFEGSLLDRSGHVEETFHSELERRGLSTTDCCIAINWTIHLPENSAVVLAEWLTALANLIRDEITPYIPQQTLLLNALCIQTTNPDLAQQVQDTANKTLQLYRREGMRLIRIAEALGKLQDYEIIDFFEDNPHWQKTLKFEVYNIEPNTYTDWIYQHSNQGEFEKTVNLIWQQYQNDYNDYQA